MSRMCDGKKRYETRIEAIHYGLNHTKSKGGAVRVYHCPICDGYHLTTQTEDGHSMKSRFLRDGEEKEKGSSNSKTAAVSALQEMR